MTETVMKAANSHMQSFIDDLVKQSTDNGMNVNQRKTKEMLIGSIVKDQPPQLTLNGAVSHHIQTARSLHLQESQVDSACRCNIVQGLEVSQGLVLSRLYFLKRLKRSGVSIDDLLCFYTTVVCPLHA